MITVEAALSPGSSLHNKQQSSRHVAASCNKAYIVKSTLFKKKTLHLLVIASMDIASSSAIANELTTTPTFDKNLLWGGSLKNLDFSKYQTGSTLPDGIYSIDISLNEEPQGRRDLQVIKKTGTAESTPCISREMLLEFGVRPESLPPAEEKSQDECVDLPSRIKNALYHFDSNALLLKISIPQIDMRQHLLGYTSPSSWDAGVPALILDYTSNAYYAKNSGITSSTAYLSTKLGINLGKWQLRNNTSINWSSNNGHSVVPIQSYLSRDLDGLRSQLILGDSFTDADLFTSVSLRGIRIASDERMKPVNDTGYAPVVRGMANSNAHVVIRQNGYIISDTTVAPGAFEIRDIAPASYNGDLDVTVTEADGKQSTFTVPFSAVPRSLREGSDRYSVSMGQVRQLNNTKPWLGQVTYQRGLSNLVTVNSGLIASDGYTALEAGSVFNTGAGAIGIDITSSHTRMADISLSGQSYRLSYNKLFRTTGTNITLAAYRYSTSGFMDVQTALNARDQAQTIFNGQAFMAFYPRLRSRGEVNINQNFNNSYSAYLSGSVQDYWGRQARDTQFIAGVRSSFKWGSLGLDAARQTNNSGSTINSVMLTLTYNLDNGKTFSSALRHDSAGNNSAQLNLNGTLDQGKKLSYGLNVSENQTTASSNSNVAGNLAYQGSNGLLNASASSATGSKQASIGLSGSVVAAADTVFFGQPLGDSTAIIEAPDAKGALVTPGIGVEVDRSGHALLSSLASYRQNDILLQTGSMSDGVQLDYSSTQVIPRSGSVVLVKFKTSKGLPLLLKTRFADDSPLPFGASVKDKDGNVVGDIGQGGKLFARVKQASGNLFVDLNEGRKCMLSYNHADEVISSFKTVICQTSLN